MKKLFLIVIMIISTCITSYTILFWKPSDKIMTENSTNLKYSENLSSKVDEENNVFKYKKDKEEGEHGDKKNNNENDISSLGDVNNEELSMAVQGNILKIEEEEISNIISKDKKEEVERIIKKLSSLDLITLKEKFNKNNKFEGFREGFNLIKRRVSDKEYEEIKEILEEYIDFSILEVEV